MRTDAWIEEDVDEDGLSIENEKFRANETALRAHLPSPGYTHEEIAAFYGDEERSVRCVPNFGTEVSP